MAKKDESKSDRHTCRKKVRSAVGWPCLCGKPAKYEHRGRWYCKAHYPSAVKAQREKRDAEQRAVAEVKWAQEERTAELLSKLPAFLAKLLPFLVGHELHLEQTAPTGSALRLTREMIEEVRELAALLPETGTEEQGR